MERALTSSDTALSYAIEAAVFARFTRLSLVCAEDEEDAPDVGDAAAACARSRAMRSCTATGSALRRPAPALLSGARCGCATRAHVCVVTTAGFGARFCAALPPKKSISDAGTRRSRPSTLHHVMRRPCRRADGGDALVVTTTDTDAMSADAAGTQKPHTVPCAYKTGRTLGQGTYAVVKEAVHIETGKYYACKVISKSLMQGREHMVRNEIASLKRVSMGHKNIVSFVDYFETMNNLYLVTDLCVGGELFDRICERGSYYEKDAAHIIQTVLGAVEYLHSQNIVHRDLKPENLLFRDHSEESDLLIADFGLSRVIDDEKITVLSTTCGTPGYMAPEIFKKRYVRLR